MGKSEAVSVGGATSGASGISLFRRLTEISQIRNAASARCIVFILLGASVLLSAVFLLPPFRHSNSTSRDVSIQASFTLPKPFSEISPSSPRLAHEISQELGVADAKLSIVDLHPLTSNSTQVLFRIGPHQDDDIINPSVLHVLRSAIVDLVLEKSNLSLTSVFGNVSSFEVLRFPGGITVIPEQSAPSWWMDQVLFNFSLCNSISGIRKNLDKLKGQLKFGLDLRSDETIYIQLTNHKGSSASAPVTIQAAIFSHSGILNLPPQRLKQIAEIITTPPSNLGLDLTLFGKVNEIQLSSYLNNSVTLSNSPNPSPSPGPSLSPAQPPGRRQRPVRPVRPPRSPRAPVSRLSPVPELAPVLSSPPPSGQLSREVEEFRKDADSSSTSGASSLYWAWLFLGMLSGTILTL